jgi:hypothetical protein
MEILERYLQAVRRYLRWKRQDDIISELRANLESQLEDKEAELGCPLTEAEAEAWLKQIGPPMQMAARYQTAQYLIGPTVFPVYKYVLRLALTWAFVVYGIVSAVEIVTKTPANGAVAAALVRLPWVLMFTAAWVTLAFAAIELGAGRKPEWFPAFAGNRASWSPAELPPLERTTEEGGPRRSRAHAIAEVVVGFLLLLWLLLIPWHPFLLLGPGVVYLDAAPFRLGAVLWQFYWWIVALNVVQVAWHAFDLARGAWQRPPRMQHIVFKTMGLIPLILLLVAPEGSLVVAKHAIEAGATLAATLAHINHGLHTGLLVVSVISGAQLAWDAGKMATEAWRKRVAG